MHATTGSTDQTSGALQVAGGVGVQEDLHGQNAKGATKTKVAQPIVVPPKVIGPPSPTQTGSPYSARPGKNCPTLLGGGW